MDRLFARYADPFSFINGMLRTGRFEEFVASFTETVQAEQEEEKGWQFFLHRVMEGSYADFRERLNVQNEHKNMSARAFETTINDSMRILEKLSTKGGEA